MLDDLKSIDAGLWQLRAVRVSLEVRAREAVGVIGRTARQDHANAPDLRLIGRARLDCHVRHRRRGDEAHRIVSLGLPMCRRTGGFSPPDVEDISRWAPHAQARAKFAER